MTFFHNTKYRFALHANSPENIAGGVIAASAMMRPQLERRQLERHRYLNRRFFDPQLYLYELETSTSQSVIGNLLTYPWFGAEGVPEFVSGPRSTQRMYKKDVRTKFTGAWSRTLPQEAADRSRRVASAIRFQESLAVEGVILPSPLISSIHDVEPALGWLDAGLDAAAELATKRPLFATLGVSDTLLRGPAGVRDDFVSALTGEFAARNALSGVYLVLESRDSDSYSIESQDVARSLLTIIDHLTRGAGLRVLTNYLGVFGAICEGAGSEISATGFYLSQRRLKLSDFHEKVARARPRYFSRALLGDVGVKDDLDVVSKTGLWRRIRTESPAAELLHQALDQGKGAATVASWSYEGSAAAAGAHFNYVMQTLSAEISPLPDNAKRDSLMKSLERVTEIARRVRELKGISRTELRHQDAWLCAVRDWREEAGV